MTQKFRKDFSAGLPFQITKHISRMVAGNLLAIGESMKDFYNLIIPNILAANGSYLVWDFDGEIFKITADAMKDKGYKIYEVGMKNKDKYIKSLFLRKPDLFFEDRVVIYVQNASSTFPGFLDLLLLDDCKLLCGQHLTIMISDLVKCYQPELLWKLVTCGQEQILSVIHADNLLLKNFSQKESMFILDSSKYKLFLDNKNDECISYLNAILPAFASSDDVIYYDSRCLQEKDISAATDVMILEKFRDMENGDCLLVEDKDSFIFDNKKRFIPDEAYENEESPKGNPCVEPEEGISTGSRLLTAAFIAASVCMLLSIIKKRRK